MSAIDIVDRFAVKYDVPKDLRDHGFVAYVHDAHHPTDPAQGCPVSWHRTWEDAQRTAAALNLTLERREQLPSVLQRLEGLCRNQAADCERLIGLVYDHLHPLLNQAATEWRKAADDLADCAEKIARDISA